MNWATLCILLLSVVNTMSQPLKFELTMDQFHGHFGVITVSNTLIGSGVVFGPHKQVVTCWHVVSGHPDCFFMTVVGSPKALHLKFAFPSYDLAVLSPSSEIVGESLKVGDFKRIRPGDQIAYCGWDSRTNAILVNSATVSAVGSAMNDGV